MAGRNMVGNGRRDKSLQDFKGWQNRIRVLA